MLWLSLRFRARSSPARPATNIARGGEIVQATSVAVRCDRIVGIQPGCSAVDAVQPES